MSEANISEVDSRTLLAMFGTQDQHLRRIRDSLGVQVSARDDRITVSGSAEAVSRATQVLEQLKQLVHRQGALEAEDVARILNSVQNGEAVAELPVIEVMNAGRKVQPRTVGQARYVEAIDKHDLVFCIGPAGTGKTYLAVAKAVSALKQEKIRKIVLVRPAVEAGESLGFLPGDMQAKINPYLRPLLDALREMIDYDQMKRYMEQDVIEVIPLAYMRGRTLNESFIILDEAQNTTISQMKMFLTRMGRNSRIVVSGDASQVDLPDRTPSGLIDAVRRLQHIKGITQVMLSRTDIVRHRLVQDIVAAYDEQSPRRR